MFTLHPQLQTDTTFITELELCLVLLINDANYPWIVLVPKRADATEIYKLDPADQTQLLKESNIICNAMEIAFKPDKLNIAAIGNMVPQLHVHHIARFKKDIAWPAPVWGFTEAVPYEDIELENTIVEIKNAITRCADA